MRRSRVKLESSCFLLEAFVFSFGGLLVIFFIACGVIRGPGDDTQDSCQMLHFETGKFNGAKIL